MAWISLGALKRSYGFGKLGTPRRKRKRRDEILDYEKFFETKADGKTLTFEMKKRYTRILTIPSDEVVPLDAAAAEAAASALLSRIEKQAPKAWHGKALKKDDLGFKIYGQFNDAMEMPIVVKQVDAERVGILFSSAGLPHLREKEMVELARGLGVFAHERKLGGKSCKGCDGVK